MVPSCRIAADGRHTGTHSGGGGRQGGKIAKGELHDPPTARAMPRGSHARRHQRDASRPGSGTGRDRARRAGRRHGVHSNRGRELQAARRKAAGARLLADAGLDRDRPDHLRPALALRSAGETAARGNRRASGSRGAGDVCEDSQLRAAVLGQPRQPQREHDAEIPADVYVRGAA